MPESSGRRPSVRRLAELGPLPDEQADESRIAAHERALRDITPPVNADEAALLVTLFGPDDCYGLAWTLLHLVESTPQLALTEEPAADGNLWLHRLWQRAERGRRHS